MRISSQLKADSKEGTGLKAKGAWTEGRKARGDPLKRRLEARGTRPEARANSRKGRGLISS